MSLRGFDETEEEFIARPSCRPRILIYLGLGVLLCMAGIVIYPILLSARPMSPRAKALSHFKFIEMGLQMYAADNDDHLPLAENWVDSIYHYVLDGTVFHSDAISHSPPIYSDPYGVAFRRRLSGSVIATINEPQHVALVFDSTDLSRNASGELSLLPNPPRHEFSDHRANIIGFVDGHASFTVPGLVVR